MRVKHWFHQLFVAIDQLLNVLVTPLQGGAWADETLSSRAFRMDRDGKPWGRFWRPVIDALFIWQTWKMDHCVRAYQAERARLHSPPEAREPA